MLRDLVAKGHELVLLRDAIDWRRFEEVPAPAYSSDNGRPSGGRRIAACKSKRGFAKVNEGLSL